MSDPAGYQATRTRMLEMLRDQNTNLRMELTAHTCALAPITPAERQDALALAESRPKFLQTRWSDLVSGEALYRCHQFAAADARLRKALEIEPDWELRPLIWLVLAMADHRLGRPDDALSWSERAERGSRTGSAAGRAERIAALPRTGTGGTESSFNCCVTKPAP